MTAAGKWLSVPAVLWAMDEAAGVPPRLRSTLFAVARYASEDGCGAYPSAAQVARITGKSRAQATRDMAELAELGLLLPGDPGLVKDLRADRRPNVWDLAMARGSPGRAQSGPPRRAPRRTPSGESRRAPRRTPSGEPRRVSGDVTTCIPLQTGVHLDAHEEVLKTSRTTRARGAGAQRAPHARQTQPVAAPANDDDLSTTDDDLSTMDDPRQILLRLGVSEAQADAGLRVITANSTDPLGYIRSKLADREAFTRWLRNLDREATP